MLCAVDAADSLGRLLCQAPKSSWPWDKNELDGMFEVARIVGENLRDKALRAERMIEQMESALIAARQGRGGEASK